MSDDDLLAEAKRAIVWSQLAGKRYQVYNAPTNNPREFTIDQAGVIVWGWNPEDEGRTTNWTVEQWTLFYVCYLWMYEPQQFPALTKELIDAARTQAKRRTTTGGQYAAGSRSQVSDSGDDPAYL